MDTRGADAPVKRSLRGGLILGAAAVVAFSLVALVHDATRDRIAASERARRVAQFDAVLGGTHHDNDLLADVTYAHDPDLLGTTSRVPVYRARLAGQPVAAVLAPVAPDGYAGSIDLLVAIGADGKVLGVHVLRHHETPGLGDAIEERKSGWIRGFIGRSLADAVRDVREDHRANAVALESAGRALRRVDGEVGGGGHGQVRPMGLGGSEGDKCYSLPVFSGLLDFGPGHLGQYDVFRHNTCTRPKCSLKRQRFARFVLLYCWSGSRTGTRWR